MTRGGGSIRGRGTSAWEAMPQPAKQERLNKRQSWQTGGYTTTSQIRGVLQEADARKEAAAWQEAGVPADGRWRCDRRWWLNERHRHLQMGDDVTISQMKEAWQEAEPEDGRLHDNQPNRSGLMTGGAQQELLRVRGTGRLQAATQ